MISDEEFKRQFENVYDFFWDNVWGIMWRSRYLLNWSIFMEG